MRNPNSTVGANFYTYKHVFHCLFSQSEDLKQERIQAAIFEENSRSFEKVL